MNKNISGRIKCDRHGITDRRSFIKKLTLYAGGAASAMSFIPLMGFSLAGMKPRKNSGTPSGVELWIPPDPPNSPIGLARGIFPGRVVWVHDPAATKWDGLMENYWFLQKYTDQEIVDKMMANSINGLAGESDGITASMRGHVYTGLTLCAKNHFGSLWRQGTKEYDGWMPDNLHQWVQRKLPRDSYSVLVDIMGHQGLDGKALLYMVDGLYAAHDQDAAPLKWTSAPFNDHWTSSIFVSNDQVALESVIVDFARNEPRMTDVISDNIDYYLHEAALADNPPSGILYAPHGDGQRLPSLGVHEHWNNAQEKKYSRNMGSGKGIELIIPI